MFTGIIEEIGQIKQIRHIAGGLEMEISSRDILTKINEGDSVAIDGVCQTVVNLQNDKFSIQAVGETLVKSTLNEYDPGRKVNLETSLTLEKPLGGHMVQGHVQATAEISRWQARGENYYLELLLPEVLLKYCIPEGSIAVDGISLTIAQLHTHAIGISVVPYTVQHTTLKEKSEGYRVNIETDIIARYVEKFTNIKSNDSITPERLKNWGY
jgi:riboflavin synthase